MISRRQLLSRAIAAPIAAAVGVGTRPAGWWRHWMRVIPPVSAGQRFTRCQYFPPLDPSRWPAVLEGIKFRPDPSRKAIEGGAV